MPKFSCRFHLHLHNKKKNQYCTWDAFHHDGSISCKTYLCCCILDVYEFCLKSIFLLIDYSIWRNGNNTNDHPLIYVYYLLRTERKIQSLLCIKQVTYVLLHLDTRDASLSTAQIHSGLGLKSPLLICILMVIDRAVEVRSLPNPSCTCNG